MALGLAKVAAKVSAVGGVLYWSVQQGIWGNSKEGSEAGKRLARAVVDPAKGCIDKIPSLTDVSSKEYWSSGVSSWLKSVPKLSDTGGVNTQKSRSATSVWDHTTIPDPKFPKEASKSAKMASKKVPGPESVPKEAGTGAKVINQKILGSDNALKEASRSPGSVPYPDPALELKSMSPQNISSMSQQSPESASKESTVPSAENEDVLAKTLSFKLTKSPTNEYIVEQIVTKRSPKHEYSIEKVTKSRLTSPPPSRDRNWPITPVKPAVDSSGEVVMRGYNYVTSVVSPPKSIVRVPTSVRVQSAEKASSPTRCCQETLPDRQRPLVPTTLQDYESADCLKTSAMLLLKHIADCEDEMVYIDDDDGNDVNDSHRTDLSERCYNTKIADLIRNSYQPMTEATENEPISPTAATLPGMNQFSPPIPMLFTPFSLDRPPSPVLLSNTNPSGRLQLLRSPRQQFYAQAFGRRSELSDQRPTTALGRPFLSGSPPIPTVLMPPRSIFKGISPAEIARSLPIRSITDLQPTKSVSIQTDMSLTKVAMKIAPVSPRKSMIANIAPPTPSYILPSPSKQMRSAMRPKTRE